MDDVSKKPTFSDIKVEEVTVEDGLHQTGHNGDHVKEAFEVETPDPVEEVEGPIHAQAEQVVGGDGLCLARLADHEELRQDRHRLQIDGERPQDLMTDVLRRGSRKTRCSAVSSQVRVAGDTRRQTHLQEREVVVDENGKATDGNNQELHSETVVVAVVGGPELCVDQVDCGVRTTDVDHLVNKAQQLIVKKKGAGEK